MSVRIKESNPMVLEDIRKHMESLASSVVAVGFPAENSEVGIPHYPNGMSILDVAVINNYGTADGHIPPRRFMESASETVNAGFQKRAPQAVKRIQEGKLTPDEYLNKEGATAQGIVSKTITDWTEPANAPSTITRKGENNPLVDTGALAQAPTYAIRSK